MTKPFPACCCQFCDDYYSPNQWYGVFCEVNDTPYLSRATAGSGESGTSGLAAYFWDAPTLYTDIAGILANWTFALTEPTIDLCHVQQYRATISISLTVLESVWIAWYGLSDPLPPIEDFDEFLVTFDNFELEVWINDYCGERRVQNVDLRCRVTFAGGAEACAGGYTISSVSLINGGGGTTNYPCATLPFDSIGLSSPFENFCIKDSATGNVAYIRPPLGGSYHGDPSVYFRVDQDAGIACPP